MSRRRRWIGYVVVVVLVGAASHAAMVVASPNVVMRVAESRIADKAGGQNAWLHAERITPQNQQVVRSSPDLAYSACVWDLSAGPIAITAPAWDDYFSLSLYQGRSDNFFAANDRSDPDGVDLVLATHLQAASMTVVQGTQVVLAPTERGVALLRYLAPTEESFAEADRVRQAAVCGS